jgi:hypothetical protein
MLSHGIRKHVFFRIKRTGPPVRQKDFFNLGLGFGHKRATGHESFAHR